MEANNFLPIGEVAKGSPCSPKPTRATTLRTRLSCADVIRDVGVPSPPASTLPASEQWVGELLMLFGGTLASAGASLLAAYESHSSPSVAYGAHCSL